MLPRRPPESPPEACPRRRRRASGRQGRERLSIRRPTEASRVARRRRSAEKHRDQHRNVEDEENRLELVEVEASAHQAQQRFVERDERRIRDVTELVDVPGIPLRVRPPLTEEQLRLGRPDLKAVPEVVVPEIERGEAQRDERGRGRARPASPGRADRLPAAGCGSPDEPAAMTPDRRPPHQNRRRENGSGREKRARAGKGPPRTCPCPTRSDSFHDAIRPDRRRSTISPTPRNRPRARARSRPRATGFSRLELAEPHAGGQAWQRPEISRRAEAGVGRRVSERDRVANRVPVAQLLQLVGAQGS